MLIYGIKNGFFFLKGLKLKRCEHEADYKHSAQKSEFLVENLKKPVKKS